MTGFVDLQVNGYAGVDFAAPGLRLDAVARAAELLRRQGTAGFCPTVVTTAPELYEAVLPVLAEACERLPGVLGIHLEGPFVSPQPGAVGAHPGRYVRPPSIALFEHWQRLSRGHLRVLTLAPEWPEAAALIGHAAAQGVLVALGHTLAGAADIAAAVAAGARLSTHLGNGCPARIDRHDNPLWPQLGEPRLSASLIADGQHLPPAFLRTAWAAKGVARLVAISDCTPIAGLPPGPYELFGSPVTLGADGSIRRPDGYFAGSSATLRQCLNHLAALGLGGEGELRQMGHDNPLALLGLSDRELPPVPVAWDGRQFVLTD